MNEEDLENMVRRIEVVLLAISLVPLYAASPNMSPKEAVKRALKTAVEISLGE